MKQVNREKPFLLAWYALVAIAVPVISLWLVSRVYPPFRGALDDAIASSPLIFGALLFAALGAATWVSYLRHAERRTTRTMVRLVIWSIAAAAFLLVGGYLLLRGLIQG